MKGATGLSVEAWLVMDVSIHAPVKGATPAAACGGPVSTVSIHAPVKGATRDDKMIAALQRLSQTYGESTLPKTVQAFGISGAVGHGLRRLLMSHPPLEERIQTLRNAPLEQVRGTVVG